MKGRTPALGTLNQKVELIKRSTAIDGTGGQQTVLTSMGSVWARIERDGVAIGEIGNAITTTNIKSITIRYRNDLSAGDRLVHRNVHYDIDEIDDLNGYRAYLICRCSRVQNIGSRHE